MQQTLMKQEQNKIRQNDLEIIKKSCFPIDRIIQHREIQSALRCRVLWDCQVGYSQVYKQNLRHKDSMILCKMKICIDENFKENQLCLLQRQISIHYGLNHPHIVRLWDVIQEKDRIYLIMEYATKGNLFNFQSHNQSFSQAQTFRLFLQTIDAIDYLHRNNIFHRDIKPQNILLDHQMNVKLCDFGWAAPQIQRKRSTFCGTYEYMAPEMINRQQYDYRIDIWALGVLLYELIHANAPFPAETFDQMKRKISSGSYQINANISSQLKNLIMSILQFDPNDRPSILQIKSNLWTQKMKKSIVAKKIQQKIEKKKGKNVYGSLDMQTPLKSPSKSKYGSSLLFQQTINKKESVKGLPSQLKKKIRKKCKTQQQQEDLEKLSSPLKNLYTMASSKENDDIHEVLASQLTKTLKKDSKYKMLTKITEANQPQHMRKESSSKICFNNNVRINNYFNDEKVSDWKNFRSDDKIQKIIQSTNRRLQAAEVKKKKKKVP